MSITMSSDERQAFLSGVHIGVVSITEPGRGPLTVPVWYDYEPGGNITFVTPADSRKAGLLTEGDRVSFCVQDEEMPPKYVTVEGPVVAVDDASIEDHVKPMAARYLGEEIGNLYVESSRAEQPRDEVLVAIRPERWLSADFAKRLQ